MKSNIDEFCVFYNATYDSQLEGILQVSHYLETFFSNDFTTEGSKALYKSNGGKPTKAGGKRRAEKKN